MAISRINDSFGRAGLLCLIVCLAMALPLVAAPNVGKISGVVVDSNGIPQMGANVIVYSEQLLSISPLELLTNERGHFSTSDLPLGKYSVKVTLAGFLPSMDQHIQVNEEHTTLLEIVLGSVVSSLDKLRHQPNQKVPPDEWAWVLRASAATRPVLQWQSGSGNNAIGYSAETNVEQSSRGQLDLTSGSGHPGSVSNFSDSPTTEVAYGWNLGNHGHIFMAGQFSYEGGTQARGFATEWLPSGEAGVGPVTSLTVQESRLGVSGVQFHGIRMSHEDQLAVGEHISIRYGGEFLTAGLGSTTEAVRPRFEMAMQIADGWMAAITVATSPWEDSGRHLDGLQSVMNTLDAFPALMVRQGRPILEDNLHDEIAVEHGLGKNAGITAAAFHDGSSQTPVFGQGAVSSRQYYLQNYRTDVFAYDAGASNSTGFRLAYREKLANHTDLAIVYAYAGALAPNAHLMEATWQDQLSTEYRHSVAGRVSATLPRTNTKITTSYKWISGPTVSRQDAYGESLYHLDPYLNLEIRQPLPGFLGHAQALMDAGNLLAQGYVPVATEDKKLTLVPSYRYFRGGFSFQF